MLKFSKTGWTELLKSSLISFSPIRESCTGCHRYHKYSCMLGTHMWLWPWAFALLHRVSIACSPIARIVIQNDKKSIIILSLYMKTDLAQAWNLQTLVNTINIIKDIHKCPKAMTVILTTHFRTSFYTSRIMLKQIQQLQPH